MNSCGVSFTDKRVVGRFAPSPTGRMHAGNIFAYLMAWLAAKSRGGDVLLRIEDIDESRSRTEYADAIMRDLESLGLYWDGTPVYQSSRKQFYRDALNELIASDNTYECFCTRAEANIQSAPHSGEESGYKGTCRHLCETERKKRILEASAHDRKPSLRCRVVDSRICFVDIFQGEQAGTLQAGYDDFILRRSDNLFAYQLAVIVDDAQFGINCVVRGYDLLTSTKRQIYLQSLLGYEKPTYGHVPLLVNEDGRRLSKRDKDASLDCMIDTYKSTEAVLGHIAYITGITECDEPTTPEQLLSCYNEHELGKHFKECPNIIYS
ncbi:tRNA glutamyl-Q(34) synthetase GluQRS [Adlercreutzia sp. ZJ154]|uniref:tRNA glutamyl-Q(34) synthetase GluQRS n=1 Tax=Adlercreutzia sp. ZJ154 TaxID=2709790 RepID=UPI0013EBACCB|nr:tRNA glutamyl-Q(34) synthetase GluQRS [Adlercreutzia sp. ZJ154]